jgi:hypothetical protein
MSSGPHNAQGPEMGLDEGQEPGTVCVSPSKKRHIDLWLPRSPRTVAPWRIRPSPSDERGA